MALRRGYRRPPVFESLDVLPAVVLPDQLRICCSRVRQRTLSLQVVLPGGPTPRVIGQRPPLPLQGSFCQHLIAKGAGLRSPRRSTSTKGARRKILSALHPNTILNPNPDPNTHPTPKPTSTPIPTPTPTPNPSPRSNPRLGLQLVLWSKMPPC